MGKGIPKSGKRQPRRPLLTKQCALPTCGAPFTTYRPEARFCCRAHGVAGRGAHSPQRRDNIARALSRQNPMRGRRHSDDTRAKMRESSEHLSGPDAPGWKGGRIEDDGYILIYAPDHPNAIGSYVAEHRMVMSQLLGRPLARDEHVHHINGITNDNRTENLRLLSREEHSRLHRLHPEIVRRRE